MKNILIVLVSFISLTAYANEEATNSVSISEPNVTSTGMASATKSAVVRKSDALSTQSIYFSLPKDFGSITQVGGYNKNQSLKGGEDFQSQIFYFSHSYGVSEELALDLSLDYLLADKDSNASSGIDVAAATARSSFKALGVNWVYGGSLLFLSNESQDSSASSEAGLAAKIGFEETSGVARWGVETEVTSKDSTYYDNQWNLIGFFEMPFFKELTLGANAGIDFIGFDGAPKNSFGKLFAEYALDASSAAQLSLKQIAEESDGFASLSETQVGVGLNKVF